MLRLSVIAVKFCMHVHMHIAMYKYEYDRSRFCPPVLQLICKISFNAQTTVISLKLIKWFSLIANVSLMQLL